MYQSAMPSLDAIPAGDDADGFDLSGIILFLRRRWKLILGIAAAIAALVALALMQSTPLYSTTSSVAVQTQKTQVVDIQDVMSGLAPDTATMETQAAILRSPRLAGMLADQLELAKDPEFNGEIARANAGVALFKPSSWFGGAARAKPSTRTIEQQKAAVIDRVMKAFEINPVPRSYVITVTTTTTDPTKSAKMANALAEIYINDGIAAKYDATRRASSFLQKRVSELRGETQAADRAAESYRGKAGLVGSTEGSTVAGQQLTELNTQLITARAERAAKEAQLQQIRSLTAGGNAGGGVEASAAILQSPLIQKLREQESEVVRNLAQLQATYGERHPKIINAEAELRDLRGKIGDEVNKVAASTANEAAIARARESALAGSVNHLEGAVNAGGQASVRLRELQRESDANRSIYEVFLNRSKETEQQVDMQTADARIVSNAEVPLVASFPRPRSTLLAAILLGLVAGLAVALALEKIDNTIRSSSVLELLGGGATLSYIPTVKGNLDRPESVLIDKPTTMVPESLRTLRSALALSDVDNPPKVVMLSSSVPAEGKTFTSTGLARVSAQSGARTILIDADMRHPRVHKALQLSNDHGLVQVLGGKMTLDEAIQIDAETGLEVLTAGHGAINPPDLLRSTQMKKLVELLRGRYDFVVIDSPPFAPLTDSQILTHLVDKMLLVVRWGETPLPVVQNTIKEIRRLKAPLVGSVLTQVNVMRHAKYGYGDYGYHYSRYSAYYGTAS